MKLSREASRLFAEYQRSQDEGVTPSYLNSENIDKTYESIRRISDGLNDIFGQVVYTIMHNNK